jgi:hypothetical protein
LVELRERDADGKVVAAELEAAYQAKRTWRGTKATLPFDLLANPSFAGDLPHLARMARQAAGWAASLELRGVESRRRQELAKQEAKQAEESAQCAALRDIGGNPYRSVGLSPDRLSGSAVSVARVVYATSACEELPVLADALKKAGCDVPDLLGHLHEPGPHVRGCWALDLVPAKGGV